MSRRSITGLAVAAIMGMAACGGGSDTLSEDDFVDEVNDLCADANDELDDIADPESVDDIADFATDSSDVFSALLEDLQDIDAPADLADDFDDAQSTIEEIIDQLAELEEIANDGDEDGALELAGEISETGDELEGLADDLGVDDCNFADEEQDEPADTTPATDPVETADTAPASTVPLTLPPTVPPTAPPATEPPATEPPAETIPESTGALFSVVDLTTVFNPPFDFAMVDTGMDAAIPFIEEVAAVPILNIGIDEMGVAALIDSFDDAVATLVVGVSLEGFGMPEEWKTQLCPPATSEIRTTAAGYTGVYCPGFPGSGVLEVFTITEGDLGVTMALVDPFYSVEDLIDAFLLANF